MNDIEKFYGKKVQITDIDGKIWNGNAVLYFPSDENDSGVESIAIRSDGVLIEFQVNEIKEIKEIA